MKFSSSSLKASLAFIIPNTKADKRIGPHNWDIISVLAYALYVIVGSSIDLMVYNFYRYYSTTSKTRSVGDKKISSELSLVVYGTNLTSTVGKRFSKTELDMMKLAPYQKCYNWYTSF